MLGTEPKNKKYIVHGKIGNSFADVIEDKNNEQAK